MRDIIRLIQSNRETERLKRKHRDRQNGRKKIDGKRGDVNQTERHRRRGRERGRKRERERERKKERKREGEREREREIKRKTDEDREEIKSSQADVVCRETPTPESWSSVTNCSEVMAK